MANSDFLNDAARWGAIVGLLLALSSAVEQNMVFSGRLGLILLVLVEYLMVAGLHFLLLFLATRRRSRLADAREGFSFGSGYGFVLTVSAFAGLILGLGNYIYIHLVTGYGAYVDRLSETVAGLVAASGTPLSETMLQVVDQIRETPAPSIFATVLGGVWSSVLFGLLFGLIIAGVHTRAPQPFDSQSND